MKRFFLLIAASFCAALTWADVTLPGWMTSNMVLQQRTKVHLQATAKKGATVKITPSWDDKTVKVVADKQTGAFEFDLDVPSAGGPFTLTFDDGKKLVLDNVMAGEVWFCSGQSNMEMPVKGWGQVLNYEQEVANANHPLIRSSAFSRSRRLWHTRLRQAFLWDTRTAGLSARLRWWPNSVLWLISLLARYRKSWASRSVWSTVLGAEHLPRAGLASRLCRM